MPTLPSSLALTNIADGALVVAADHRNNYAAIQTAVNSLITTLGSGVTGQFLAGNGTTLSWLQPPGTELDYHEFTAGVAVTATTEGGSQTLVSASAITFDGATAVEVEFFCPQLTHSAVGTNVYLDLFDSGTPVGIAARMGPPTNGVPVYGRRRFTPSAGSHTYKWNAFTDSGTATFNAFTGGAGLFLPGFIKIRKV